MVSGMVSTPPTRPDRLHGGEGSRGTEAGTRRPDVDVPPC
jgi:hypothetical protein